MIPSFVRLVAFVVKNWSLNVGEMATATPKLAFIYHDTRRSHRERGFFAGG